MLSELDGIYPMTFYSGPEGVRVKVSPLFFFLLLCSEFPELCSVTKPKLGLSLGTKVKILLHHTVVIDFHCVRVELEDIDKKRLDIDVFWIFLFPRDLHCTDTSLLSQRRSISRIHTQNCCA